MKVYLEDASQKRRFEVRASSVVIQLAVTLSETRTYIAWRADGRLK